MFVVGMTGGIGSGKSVVARMFAELDIPIIDADIIAREITEPGKDATKAIEKHFGTSVINPDGSLDRSALRRQIFDNTDQRQWLEDLLHPLIKLEMQTQISSLDAPYCVAVIPLLLEVEFYSLINRILVVDTTEKLQIERAAARDNMSREDALKIIHAQAKREARIKKAHDVIRNTGTLDELRQQVLDLHKRYLQMAQTK